MTVMSIYTRDITSLTFSFKKSIHIQFFTYKSKTIKATDSCKSLVNEFVEFKNKFENKFLNSLFTMNYYSYCIEIL